MAGKGATVHQAAKRAGSPNTRLELLATSFKIIRTVFFVDEAGRGPVLGPMVYAAAFCEEDYTSTLADM